MKFVYLEDRNQQERIIRTRYPAFTATIRDAYDAECGEHFQTFDGKKICVDELFHDAPDSKINWALKEAIKHYQFTKKKMDESEAKS